jgi:hypothetical protein
MRKGSRQLRIAKLRRFSPILFVFMGGGVLATWDNVPIVCQDRSTSYRYHEH